jgi:transglutaminase-like putative cysteine protease
MITAVTRNKWGFTQVCCLAIVLGLQAITAVGQNFDDIYNRYKGEQAVITNIREELVITSENGKLVASSKVSKEKMLIGDMSPGIYNTEYIYHSYFNQLEDHDEEALVPGKNGYKKISGSSSKTVHSESSDVFYDDAKQTEISFCNLTPKSLLRTNYTITHADLHMLPVFYFEDMLPTVQSTYEVTVPKYVDIRFVVKGYGKDRIIQKREEHKKTVTYTFTATNMPAFKSYSDVPSVRWYDLHVVPYISSYQLPDRQRTEMLSDPEHLYNYYYDFVRNVNTKEDETIKATVNELTKGDRTVKEKAAHIYSWVQQNIHYIAFEDSLGGFIPRQAADIYKRKFGDCKDMTSILVAMCRSAGIDAYFTWIGTRSKPYTYAETPAPIVDNHMICTVRDGGEWIFLDGTHSLIPFGVVPQGIQGKEALVGIDDKSFKIILVPERKEELNSVTDSTFLKISGKNASGTVAIRLHGYPSWEAQSTMMYNKNRDRDEKVRNLTSRGSNKFVQQNYQYSPGDSADKSTVITADFTINDYVQKVANEYVVNMNLCRYFGGGHIDTNGRNVPVFYLYKEYERHVVTLEIPDGYHVSYLPPETKGALNDTWNYSIRYSVEGKKLVLTKEYQLRSMNIPVAAFAEHNKLVDELKKQYKESVVLLTDK